MSDARPPDALDEVAPDMTAAELALGVLEGEERAAAMRRVLAEPAFARSVEQWRSHLAVLFDVWPAIETRDILARIERTLDAPVASIPVMPRRAPSRLWPGLAALSSIAAAGLLVMLVTRPVPTPPVPTPPVPTAVPSAPIGRPTAVAVVPLPVPSQSASRQPAAPPPPAQTPAVRPPTVGVAPAAGPMLVASIVAEKDGNAVTAVYDPRAGALRLTQAALADADRSAELWVIGGDGVPHSLGLLHAAGTTRFALTPDNRTRIAAGAVLAVSLEPIGGSPTGLPTGPVVAKGALSKV